MSRSVDISGYVASLPRSPLASLGHLDPWQLTEQSSSIVRRFLANLSPDEFEIVEEMAVHRSAVVEPGSILKSPLIIGAGCFVAAGAYIRGGCWVGRKCTLGPGSELKSSFLFDGSKLAHFNFVGDSILGADVNLEAGSVICNFRNERASGEVLVRIGADLRSTGSEKFGALVGDHSRIGANAVVAPGAILRPGTILARGRLCDQEESMPEEAS